MLLRANSGAVDDGKKTRPATARAKERHQCGDMLASTRMASDKPTTRSWPNKTRSYLPLVLIFFAIPFYWMGVRTPSVGYFHDDGIYLVTAKSLAEGQGYRIISLPDRPPQTKYPVLYPLILAALWRILPPFPRNLLALKLTSTIFVALWLFLSYKLLTRHMRIPHEAALWMLGMISLTLWSFMAGTLILSEAAFGTFLMATLFLLCGLELGQAGGWSRVVWAGVLATATYQVRTAGVVLLPAGAVALWIARRRREALLYSAPILVVMALWSVWQWQEAPGYATTAQTYYTAVNLREFNPIFATRPLQATARIVFANTISLFAIPLSGFSLRFGTPVLFVAVAIGVFVWLAALTGLLRCNARSIVTLILLYIGMVLIYAWPPARFVLPVFPILMACAYHGTPARYRVPLAIAFSLALIPDLARFIRYTPAKQTIAFAVDSPDWSSTSKLYSWISRNTERNAVIGGALDPGIYLFTGRLSIRPYRTEPMAWTGPEFLSAAQKVAEFKAILRSFQIKYYAEDGDRSLEDPDYNNTVQALQQDGTLSLIRQFGPTTRIFSVNNSPAVR